MAPRKRPDGDGNLSPLDGDKISKRQLVIIEPDVLKTIDDYAVAGTEYIGWAACDSLTSAAVWKIMRKVTVASVETVTWADGNGFFDNIWDNRAALTYK